MAKDKKQRIRLGTGGGTKPQPEAPKKAKKAKKPKPENKPDGN